MFMDILVQVGTLNVRYQEHAMSPSPEREVTHAEELSTPSRLPTPEHARVKKKELHSSRDPQCTETKATAIPEQNIKVTNKIESQNKNVSDEGLYQLWVDKYKPTSLKQIIGQQGEKSNVNKLVKWLKSWWNNHCGDRKLSRPSKL